MLPTSFEAFISSEPDPQVGSYILSPSFAPANFASKVETSAGVKNSPPFFPASPAKWAIRYSYESPITSFPASLLGLRSNSSLLKSSNKCLSIAFFSLVLPN